MAASATLLATLICVALRWHWDRSLPRLGLATLCIVAILTAAGLIFKDETFVMLRPTIGVLTFAAILRFGALAKPSLLERTLGYKIKISHKGWNILHLAWISITLIGAGVNEFARRFLSTDHWALYNVLSDPVIFGCIYGATYIVAERYWLDGEPAAG